MASKNKTWKIVKAKDYHEFYDYKYNGWKYKELGCFATKDDIGYNLYFAVVYKGRLPKFKDIWNRMRRKIAFDESKSFRFVFDCFVSEQEAKEEVKENLYG